MNTYSKMHRINRILKDEMRKNGIFDIQMFPHTMYFKDIWGWDGVARISEGFKESIVWFQLKTGYVKNEDKNNLKKFCLTTGEYGLIVEYLKKMKDKKKHYEVRITPIGFDLESI